MTLARPVLLSLQGSLTIMRGELGEGKSLLDQAFVGLSKEDDPYQLALALSRRSTGLRLLGRYADAKNDAEQSLLLSEKIESHPRAHAEAQRALGSALLSMGQTHRAFEQLNLAHEAYKSLGDMASAARTKLDIGMAQRSLGQLDEAEIAYTQALELWEETGNLAWQANLLNNLGVLQHERGDYLPAAHSLERAVECARLSSYPRMEAFALAGLGDLYRDLEALTNPWRLTARRVHWPNGRRSATFYFTWTWRAACLRGARIVFRPRASCCWPRHSGRRPGLRKLIKPFAS